MVVMVESGRWSLQRGTDFRAALLRAATHDWRPAASADIGLLLRSLRFRAEVRGQKVVSNSRRWSRIVWKVSKAGKRKSRNAAPLDGVQLNHGVAHGVLYTEY